MGIEVAFQLALYQRVMTLGLPVHDVLPQVRDGASTVPFPCFVIGAVIPAKWDTYTETGFDIAFRLHTYHRSTNMLPTKELQGRLYDLLHRQDFAIEGHRLVLCDRETTTCDRAADGSMHGICTYRALIAAN